MTRNIVLIVLDTVRKDYYDDYAHNLQYLSDVSFAQCRAASSTSVPSHASIMTGKLPHQHGIHSYSPYFTDLDVSETFLGKLQNHHTVGLSANAFAGSSFDFDHLFEDFTDITWTRRLPGGMDLKEFAMTTDNTGASMYVDFLKTAMGHGRPIQTLANAAMARFDLMSTRLPLPRLFDDGAKAILKTGQSWIRENEEPFFMFVNLMDAHTPHRDTRGYDGSLHNAPSTWNSMDDLNQWEVKQHGLEGHESDVENFRDLYAASIDYLDSKVSSFIEKVDELTEKETTYVITSDHGENLGFAEDDELLGHKSSLSEALLHVPLDVVNPPQGYNALESGYVSQLELGRLLVGLAHGETPDVCADRVAAERIGTTNTPDFSDDAERAYWTRMLRCVYENERKYVWDSLDECVEYELDHKRPCWQRPRAEEIDSPPKWADEFFDVDIHSYKHEFSSGADLEKSVDDATRARLEELGYL